ncbi:tetratricopeptide repeat protein [Tenacibaculum geojense]|uniref:Tetratricopeptide repeat protein n=1 Tax=Tenacibaculum geojense TaxID=915352 RepID=A0ABW3JU56_9FLAO
MRTTFLLFLTIFLFSFTTFSQKDNDEVIESINTVIDEKPKDYFILFDYFDNAKLSSDEAQLLFDKSLETKYVLGQIFALNALGRNEKYQSNFKEALNYYFRSLKLSEITNNKPTQVLTKNIIAGIYKSQDDIRNALDYYQSAISIAKEIKNPSLENRKSISVAHNSIGNIYISINQYELALEKFLLCIKIEEELNDKTGLAINYQNMGKVLELMGSYDEAIENYTKSLEFNNDISSKTGRVICYNSICSALVKKGDYQIAYDTILKIFPESQMLRNKFFAIQTLTNLGLTELKLKNYNQSKSFLKQALETANDRGFIENEINASFHLSELYEAQDSARLAFKYYKRADKLQKKTTLQKNIIYVNNLISKHELQSKANEINTLENRSKIQTLQLARNRNILIITLITLALISVALYSLYIHRMLTNEQKILLLEQQALQTQMNPHFIFNALNSIKLYIINNEQKNAVYYLNKFSKLIRNILDVSKIKEVALKEELNTMDLYMSIENIRFNNEINYIVDVDKKVNTDTIKVPPLILQPFLENAIWHGLSSKKGVKKINLLVRKISSSLLEVTIEDNGIGRDAAGAIKKEKSLKRKSIGIDLTKERLKTFANDYSGDCSVIYTDLKDKDNKPTGTKVSLVFPLN